MRRVTQTAAGVVLFRDGGEARRYLLMRSALTRRPIWEFPKGGVEAGETEAQAAVRELWEESGIGESQISVLEGYREEERYVFTQGQGEERTLIVKKVIYFLATTDEERVVISREAEEYRWATYEEAMRLIRFPGKRRVLEVAEALLARVPARSHEGTGERVQVTGYTLHPASHPT
ncbi:MAG TPA: NUDIX domain-containing protein [Longimicrobium sp.]|nr:NUDIX domain-containing protein [Longimicrobium sp.]